MEKIWKGRINKDTDSNVEKFTSSLDVDKSLYMYDVIGTIAHVVGLKKIGIITDNELKRPIPKPLVGLINKGLIVKKPVKGRITLLFYINEKENYIQARLRGL